MQSQQTHPIRHTTEQLGDVCACLKGNTTDDTNVHINYGSIGKRNVKAEHQMVV